MGLLGCGVICLLFFCSLVAGMGKEGVHPVLVSGGGVGPVSRSVYSLDFGWKFYLYPQTDICSNSSNPFPNKLIDKQCLGLNQVKTANSSQECEQACCQQLGCYIWQWCQNSSCNPVNSCWAGVSSDCDYNAGWISGEAPLPPAPSNSCNVAECTTGFDDSSWRTLNLPHDFVIEGTFSPYAQRSHAYLPTGMAWYRLHFNLPAGSEGASIWLTFDGIYRNSVTFLNGEYLGTHPSGYTSFIYDISNQTTLNFSGPNVLAIYVDATEFEGWWYEGGGIYRHVWLTVADPLHVKPWGVFAPSVITGEITNVPNEFQFATEAVVYFETDIINTRTQIETFTLISTVDYTGKSLGSVSSTVTLIPQQETNIAQTLVVENVFLWSAENPVLYNVTTSIVASGVTIDTVVTTIGIRKVVFDVDQGLFINNYPVKINGVCNHQDFAGTGTAVPNRVNEFRVLKLKEMGINGWRMSHNPPNPELLDFTDLYGIYVMDENRNFANYSQYYSDMELMVLRDRNHPSIIMWSVCNEVGCMEGDPSGAVVGAAFKAIAKNADPTRVVAAAMNNDWGVGLSMVLDAQGVNYNYQVYPTYHNTHDYQPMFGSETASCLGARSIYVTNATACHLAIYNTDGCINQWTHAVQGAPYIAGGFSWTGFDYKGEPTPYNWPDVNSNFGTIDLAGFPKDTFWFYQSWYTNLTVLHLFPHWNWEVGDNVSVWAYTNAASVELFVDGISQGVQSIPYLGRAGWNVVWKGPGTIEAKAYNVNQTVIANQTITTTGTPYAIGLTVETPSTIAADGQDVALIAVSILDQNGLIVPTASNYVNFTVTSNGSILGVGNGDPSCLEPDKASGRSAFGGLARVIVQSLQGVTGTITLVAQSEGLAPAKIAITAQ